jgi:hypothetical protein
MKKYIYNPAFRKSDGRASVTMRGKSNDRFSAVIKKGNVKCYPDHVISNRGTEEVF